MTEPRGGIGPGWALAPVAGQFPHVVRDALPGWSATAIAGRPNCVFDPPGRRGVVLYLHPHTCDQLAHFWAALTAALAAHQLACVATFRTGSWWVGEAERHVIDGLVPWVRQTWGARQLAAVGVGSGGQGAVRLGFRRPDLFPVVGSIAGAFDFHERYGQGTELDDLYPDGERARQDTAVLQLNPTAYPPHIWFACDPTDHCWRGNDRLHEKLTAYGVPHVADLDTEAGGHTWAYFDAMVTPLIDWTAAALVGEQRRLL